MKCLANKKEEKQLNVNNPELNKTSTAYCSACPQQSIKRIWIQFGFMIQNNFFLKAASQTNKTKDAD